MKIKNNVLLILVIITIIVYYNSMRGEFISDDISLPQVIKHLNNIPYMLSHGMAVIPTVISYIPYKINPAQPFFFHLENIIIHIINVCLVYLIIRLLCKKNDGKIAFFTAALFAVHPVLTEVVSWISGMSYALYSLFFLGSFYLYIKYILYKCSKKYYYLSLILFSLAVLTSVKAVIFPGILIVFFLIYVTKKRNWLDIIPYIIISCFSVVFSIIPNIGPRLIVARISQGAAGLNFLLPFVSVATYLKLLVWPEQLTFYYVDPINRGDYIFSFIVCGVFLILLIYFWKKEKTLFFWLTFFIISLSLVISPLPLASFVAERYVYLGSIGIIYIIVFGFIRLTNWLKMKYLDWVIFVICLLLLSGRTIERNNDWRTNLIFWQKTATTSTFSYQAHDNYGALLIDKGRPEEAAGEFTKSLALKPDYGLGHQGLGYAYQLMGRLPEALQEYQSALYLYKTVVTPASNLEKIYQNMGGIYLELGQDKEAINYAEKALVLDPHNADLISNVGIIYYKIGDKENARKYFTSALKLKPNFPKAMYWTKQL